MTSSRTQIQRVAALLRERGPLGITCVDFQGPHVADGGRPVLRLGARVWELQTRHGHVIESELVTLSGGARVSRYRLVGSSPGCMTPAPLPGVADAGLEQLGLDVGLARPRARCAVLGAE